MRILGIDPGSISAAYAVVSDNPGTGEIQPIAVGDVPVVDRMVDAVGFANILRQHRVHLIVIEKVSAMPKQGVSSTFRFGMGCGLLRGVVAALALPLTEVSPTVWKREFKLDNDGEKSRALAIRLFPALAAQMQRKKDHGRAEALLIASWQLARSRVELADVI
jgi:Holliday junction resolvasome RuvABC endonuclease subunit